MIALAAFPLLVGLHAPGIPLENPGRTPSPASTRPASGSSATVRIVPYVQNAEGRHRIEAATAILRSGEMELITDYGAGQVLLRRVGVSSGASDWQPIPLPPLNRPHSVAEGPKGVFYVNTAGDGSLYVFDLSAPTKSVSRVTQLAGHRLFEPHDHVFDEVSGWHYVLQVDGVLHRFRSIGEEESSLLVRGAGGRVASGVTDNDARTGPAGVGSYSRSLSFVDGKVWVIGSSAGRVIRIDDFDRGLWTTFQSGGKRSEATSGSLEETGLVLNDVEFFDGWWYGSNMFVRPADAIQAEPQTDATTRSVRVSRGDARPAENGSLKRPDRRTIDYSAGRLIRWRDWTDFEAGRWEDLSTSLPPDVIAYYFTRDTDALYLACFEPQFIVPRGEPGKTSVYRITHPPR